MHATIYFSLITKCSCDLSLHSLHPARNAPSCYLLIYLVVICVLKIIFPAVCVCRGVQNGGGIILHLNN